MLHKTNSKILTKYGIKRIVDLKIGDKIFGPNYDYKTITELNLINKNIFEIQIINDLKLYCFIKDNIYIVSTTPRKQDIYRYSPELILKIEDYILTNKTFKNMYKIKTSECLKFKYSKLAIDPYFLGLLLGDGSLIGGINITTMDDEIKLETFKQANNYNLTIRQKKQHNNKSCTYHFSSLNTGGKVKNNLINDIRNLNLFNTNCENKFIPDIYKINSIDNRLKLLAGLMDTDGSNSHNCFDYISKSEQLAKDVCFIAGSLGFRYKLSSCIKSSQNGTSGLYYRVIISGHTNLIPTKLKQKQCSPRMQKKNHNRFGFKILPFETEETMLQIKVDADGLYIDENFFICAS